LSVLQKMRTGSEPLVDDVEVRNLRRVYRDLCITPESLRLKVFKTVNRYSLVAHDDGDAHGVCLE
jgi:hypothetical protein